MRICKRRLRHCDMFTLVIGGSASGKSDFAERHVVALGTKSGKEPEYGKSEALNGEGAKRLHGEGVKRLHGEGSKGLYGEGSKGLHSEVRSAPKPDSPRIYIATMEPFGEEAQARIARHHAMRRERGFKTVECYRGLGELRVPKNSNVLLEDMGNLLANEMFGGKSPVSADRIVADVEKLLAQCRHLTIVTNEVFSGGKQYQGETLEYLRVLALINRRLAEKADLVVEMVCGLPDVLKGRTEDKHMPGRGQEMIFVTGPLFAGKQEYIMEALGWSEEDFEAFAIRDVQDLADGLVRGSDLKEGTVTERIRSLADSLADKKVIIATEVGGGVVPIDPVERRSREAAGRLACMLTERADTVVRVCCGIPRLLKGESLP